MTILTKEELIFSFRAKNTKRQDALYNYYKVWFDLPLTAPMLARRISTDLGIPIREDIIYHIRSKHKSARKLPTLSGQSPAGSASAPVKLAIPDLTDKHFHSPTIQFLND